MQELKKAKKRHLSNIATVSELKTLTKRFEDLLQEKNAQKAKSLLIELISKIDKAVKKGVVHENTASRKKSRLSRRLLTLSKA
jgi:small subunit ribosomal protein S20